MSEKEQVRVYLVAELENTDDILRLRNEVWQQVGGYDYFKKHKPYIVVLPHFKVDKDSKIVDLNIGSLSDLVGSRVDFGCIEISEGSGSVNYVNLQTEVNMEPVKSRMVRRFERQGVEDVQALDNTVLKLLEAKDKEADVPDDVYRKVGELVGEGCNVDSTKIESVKIAVEKWG